MLLFIRALLYIVNLRLYVFCLFIVLVKLSLCAESAIKHHSAVQLTVFLAVAIRCPQPQSGMRHLVNAYEVEAGTV